MIRAMDRQISDHVAWDDYDKWTSIMAEFFTQDMIYDTNYYDGSNELMGNGTGIKRFAYGRPVVLYYLACIVLFAIFFES